MDSILGTLFGKILGLLGVVAVLTVAYQVLSGDKVSGHIADLSNLNISIQSTYGGQGNFTTLDNTVAAKLAPTSMGSTGTLRNRWDATMTVAVNVSNAARYDVTDPGLPADACRKVATSLGPVVGLTINSTAITLPADAGTLVTACNLAANTMVYTYGR